MLKSPCNFTNILRKLKADSTAFGFSNYVHLLVQSSAYPLAKFMQGLQQSYTQYFNKRHEKTGHLLERRYKAILSPSAGASVCDYLLILKYHRVIEGERAPISKKQSLK